MNQLKNNSKEMATIVETYIIEETAPLIHDDEQLNKWNKAVEELCLKGQTEIVTKTKSPIPFMHLKKSMKNVFEELCPRKVKLEEYNITPIPVEILELALLSKRENYFKKIEIWYDDAKPDPTCIGVTGDYIPIAKGYKWFHEAPQVSLEKCLEFLKEKGVEPYEVYGGSLTNEKHYLMGRWADVKHSFAELIEMAKKRFLETKEAEIRKKLKDAQRELDDLETECVSRFVSGTSSFPF